MTPRATTTGRISTCASADIGVPRADLSGGREKSARECSTTAIQSYSLRPFTVKIVATTTSLEQESEQLRFHHFTGLPRIVAEPGAQQRIHVRAKTAVGEMGIENTEKLRAASGGALLP